MKEIVTTITQRSQVTLPAEVRRVLGLKPRDQVAFAVDNGEVRLVPAQFTLESAYGSVDPLNRSEDLEDSIHQAKAAKADKAAGSAS